MDGRGGYWLQRKTGQERVLSSWVFYWSQLSFHFHLVEEVSMIEICHRTKNDYDYKCHSYVSQVSQKWKFSFCDTRNYIYKEVSQKKKNSVTVFGHRHFLYLRPKTNYDLNYNQGGEWQTGTLYEKGGWGFLRRFI